MRLDEASELRKHRIATNVIQKFDLNLEGLTVFTEAASGNYKYAPIIAAMAGATRVFAVAVNSRYGTREAVRELVLREAEAFGVADRIVVLFDKDMTCLSASDIVTNSGFVRPITREMISMMKPTAVIPLMWETWEFRPQDLDLDACREHGILVLGTDEHHPLLELFRSNGFLICKLLFDKGFDVYKDNLLLVSSGYVGDSAADFFMSNGIQFDRVSFDKEIAERHRKYIISHVEALDQLAKYDAMIIAELHHSLWIVSKDGVFPVSLLKAKNPLLQIVHICGSVNRHDIVGAGLDVYPDDVRPFGHMTVSPDYLGPKTVLELLAAGLKVGEVMARCRLSGMPIEAATQYALENSPAMDF